MTKQPTSLEKVRAALTEHAWLFTVESTTVRVPDPDPNAGSQSRFSSRRRHVPKIGVPGYVVRARNGFKGEKHYDYEVHFSASFTESGAYLSDQTSGVYPFNIKGLSMTRMLKEIEIKAPGTLVRRRAEREEDAARRQSERDAKVLAAYAEATEKVTEAQHSLFTWLTGVVGVSEDHARTIVATAQAEQGVFPDLAKAKHEQHSRGKGWLPGDTSLSGTYVDGVRVSD